MNPVRSFFLFLVGIVVGIFFVSIIVSGVSIGLVAFAIVDTTSPVDFEGLEIGPGQIGTLQQEAVAAVAEMDLSGGLTLSESVLTRLLGAAIVESLASKASELSTIAVDVSPNHIDFKGRFHVVAKDYSSSRSGTAMEVKPVDISVFAGFDIRQTQESMTLEMTDLQIGRTSLPVVILRVLLSSVSGEMEVPGTDLPVSWNVGDMQVWLPNELVTGPFHELAKIRRIALLEDEVQVAFIVEQDQLKNIFSNLAPIVQNDGRQAVAVLERELPADKKDIAGKARELLAGLSEFQAWESEKVVSSVPFAVISYLEKDVVVVRQGRELLGETGGEVYQNDLVRTGPGGVVELILPNASVVKVAENTEFLLSELPSDKNQGQTVLSLSFGQVRSKVEKLTSSAGSFEIVTPSAVMGVRGTDFVVSYSREKGLAVKVLEGIVAVTGSKNQEVLVKKRQKIVTTADMVNNWGAEVRVKNLSSREVEEINDTLPVVSNADERLDLLKSRQLVQLLEGVRELLEDLLSLDRSTLEKIVRELEAVIDFQALAQSFLLDDLQEYMEHFNIDLEVQ